MKRFTGTSEAFLKQRRPSLPGFSHTPWEGGMRTLIFGAALIAVASVGSYILITNSLAVARDAKPATFSERFAPVLKPT